MGPDEDPIAEEAFDALADEYADTVRESAYNAYLEFPATSDLVPDVDGERVLDAGLVPASTPSGCSSREPAKSSASTSARQC